MKTHVANNSHQFLAKSSQQVILIPPQSPLKKLPQEGENDGPPYYKGYY